jgi:hypothetical protein
VGSNGIEFVRVWVASEVGKRFEPSQIGCFVFEARWIQLLTGERATWRNVVTEFRLQISCQKIIKLAVDKSHNKLTKTYRQCTF